MRKIIFDFTIFLFGGLCYGLLEVIWRHYTHWSMIITGGVCFFLMYRVYSSHPNMNYLYRAIVGSLIITSVELVCGCIVNLWLKLNVWDYSRFQFNLFGQICLLYSVLWGLLSIPVSALCIKIKGIENKLMRKRQIQT